MKPVRNLASILFTDIVGSTERASALGDRDWRALQARHHRIVREEIRRWGGEEVTEAGDGFLALFERPDRAILAAAAARDRVREIGLEIRCGVHLGQADRGADDSVGGIAVHVGARVAGEAGPGEIVVTSMVRDAEEGSGFGFEDLGRRALKGVEREWRLFRVTAIPGDAASLAPGLGERVRRRAAGRPAVFATLALGLFVAFLAYRTAAPGQGIASEIRSIGVLPLDNLTGDPEQAYLVDGTTEALIAELSKIASLNVISRTSTERYRDTDLSLPEIAEALGATGVVEGSVARVGDRIRITVQLIHAGSDTHVWADAYETDLADLAALQGEIARTIAREIRIALSPEERERLAAAPRIDPAAYDAYLKGRYHLNRQTPESVLRGLEYLREAVEIDPDAALPHAGLALGYSLAAHGPDPPPGAFQQAKVSARRALERDEALAEVHAAIAQIRLYQDWDWEGAEASFRRALALNPSLPEARAHWSWWLVLNGRDDEARVEMRRAMEADPLAPLWPAWLAWQQWWDGDGTAAIETARGALELAPEYPVALYVLGSVFASQGRFDAAVDAHERAGAVSPQWRFGLGVTYAQAGNRSRALEVARDLESNLTTWDTFFLAEIHTALDDPDAAFRWLEAAHAEPHHPYIPWMRTDPLLLPLRDDPRFAGLLRRMDLEPPDGSIS